MLTRFIEPFAELVRWGEPWDLEDDDPLLDQPATTEDPLTLWT